MANRRYASRADLFAATQSGLGSPVINIEVFGDQYNTICNKCIDICTRYLNDDGGTYQDYFFLTTTSGVSEYSTSAWGDVVAVKEVQFYSGFGQVNQLFTAQHNILTDQQGKFRLFNNDYAGRTPGLELAAYQSAMQYLELTKELLAKDYWGQCREMEQTIIIRPTPKEVMIGLVVVERKESELNIINNILFRNLFTAAIKKLWGEHLDKYSTQMPGSGTVNSARIISDAKEEYADALATLKSEAFPTPFSVF